MKIKTKLTIAGFLPLGLFLVIGFMYIYTSWQIDRAATQAEMAARIGQKVIDQGLVTQYLLLRHEDRPRVQLQNIRTSLAELIGRVQPKDPEQEFILRRLRRNQEGITFLISRLVDLWGKGPRSGDRRELEDRMTSQVLERIREMASDAEQLEMLARGKVTSAREQGYLITLLLVGLCSGLVLLISLLIMRRTSSAISKLQKGTRIIAEGDLDYMIPFTANDELAQLSEAFNNMAAELKKSYAALQQEVFVRTQAEEAIEKYAAQLEVSNRELQDFAFVASHDLQEPLRKIQAFGDQLKSGHTGSLDAEGLDYLDRMQNAAVRMQGLIQSLLNYSRVTTKAQPFTAADLAAVAREAVLDLEATLEETGGRVEIGELATIEADPLQMRQLFQNLIGNALKFHGDEKPVVRVYGETIKSPGPKKGASRDGSYRVFIEDNGIGFDEKYLDRIFTPFQRLHGRGVYEGTGIGLAICRKIVERHGGTITAKSSAGKGSTFVVTLPAKQPRGGTE